MNSQAQKNKTKFTADMTVDEAMRLHPDVGMILAGFHLGGCAHCGINQIETLEQVCMGYGIPIESLLDTLNSLE